MRTQICVVAVALLLAGTWAVAQDPPAGAPLSSVNLPNSLVTLINEAEVSPQEAGIITAIEAYEGLEVEEGTVLALIDDSLPRSEKAMAEAERRVAIAEAENRSEELVANATYQVAEAEYNQVLAANKQAPGAKSMAEVNIKKLNMYRAKEQITHAQMTRTVARIKAEATDEKVKAADIAIERRKIAAPVTGKVVKVYRHRGEYANPTEPVLRIVRLDRLRVVAFVDHQQFAPGDLHARPVTLNVQLSGGRPGTFEGKITFVSPLIQATSPKFEIHAEIVNRQENGEWLLQPGLIGTLAVDLTHRLEQREAGKETPAGPSMTRTR